MRCVLVSATTQNLKPITCAHSAASPCCSRPSCRPSFSLSARRFFQSRSSRERSLPPGKTRNLPFMRQTRERDVPSIGIYELPLLQRPAPQLCQDRSDAEAPSL